jgi:hypothetical protein
MALEALEISEKMQPNTSASAVRVPAIQALRQALAQPVDAAIVAEVGIWGDTAPPKREWVGLTRREFDIATLNLEDLEDCYIAIEAKLKEKNT